MPLFTVWYYSKTNIMNNANTLKFYTLSPLWLHSDYSMQIPQSINRYNSMLPFVYISPLKIHSATWMNAPIKLPALRNSRSKYRRSVMFYSISKFNVRMCSCCKHLRCISTVKSKVNGRQFSVVTNSDLDWRSFAVIKDCGMHFVDQTSTNVDFFKLHLLSTIVVWKSLTK